MPKYRIRKSGESTRISKGKCGSEVNFDILEQCVDEEKIFNCDEELQVKTDEEPLEVDTRTSDEIILDAFQEFNSKSYQARTSALTIIVNQLQLSHKPYFLTKHIDRLVDIIENALKRNFPCEINAAARLISLAAIQLPDRNRSMQKFYEPLKSALKNENLKSSNRSAICYAMGILTFLYETNSKRISMAMQEFKDIFPPDDNYNKANKTIQTAANFEYQTAAFETWIFLFALLPSRFDCSRTQIFTLRSVGSFISLLESPCFNIRVTCAKAIAVIFECGHDYDKKYLGRYLAKIINKTKVIVNMWNKHANDIKSTREVLLYLEKGIAPTKEIRNGKCELLNLNNWALNVQYEMFCNVIGSANVAKHLSKNGKLLSKIMMAQSTEASTVPPLEDSPSSLDSPADEPYHLISHPIQQKVYDLENISKNFENATHKSSFERINALEEICKELHVVPQVFLADQKNVILDIVLKAMKRGNEAEQLAVVRLATLTVLLLGHDERFCSEISSVFFNSLKQSSSSIATNASICTALAFFELVDTEHGKTNVLIEPIMSLFRQIFSESHLKTLNADSSNEQSNLLRIKALEAWGLLLSLYSYMDLCSLARSQLIKNLTEMMHTTDVELRIVCGQVISLIVEQGRIYDNGYLQSDIPEICNVIKDIVNDRRYISGDKRKMQNPKLREILKYLEDGCHSSFKLRFADEVHELKTLASIFKHQKLSQFIGPNLAAYVLQSERIRDIISIGPKPIPMMFQLKPNLEYKLNSAAQRKSKTKENRLNSRTPKFDYV